MWFTASSLSLLIVTSCCAGDEQADGPLLARTVQSALAQAEAHGMQSIAMPLIGAGRAGWPVQLAAQIHVAEVVKLKASGNGVTVLQVGFLHCRQ